MALTIASATTLSVAAGAKSADQVSGTYQFIGPGLLTLAAKASAAAATGMRVTLICGGIPLINDQLIPFAGATGSMSINDNILISQMVSGGRVELTYRNDSAGTLTTDYQLSWTKKG